MADEQNTDQNTDPKGEESGSNEAQTFTKDEVQNLIAEQVATATEALKKEYAGIQSGLQKAVNEKDAELENLRKQSMSEEEKRQAEAEETRRLILEERALRLKAENRAAARDMLTEAGIARVPRILDELVKDDPEATKASVSKYIEEWKEERAEWAKEHDRANGRTVTGQHDSADSDNELPKLTPDQLRRLPPDVRAQYSAQ